MREIAFRQYIWNEDGTGKMLSWEDLLHEEDESLVTTMADTFANASPLMQYTGLKDKNGTEIYEGDVLTAGFYPYQDEGKYNYHGLVEWIEDRASFYLTKRLANKDKRGISDGISEPIEYSSDFEVIGNIYENPELLEGESK